MFQSNKSSVEVRPSIWFLIHSLRYQESLQSRLRFLASIRSSSSSISVCLFYFSTFLSSFYSSGQLWFLKYRLLNSSSSLISKSSCYTIVFLRVQYFIFFFYLVSSLCLSFSAYSIISSLITSRFSIQASMRSTLISDFSYLIFDFK